MLLEQSPTEVSERENVFMPQSTFKHVVASPDKSSGNKEAKIAGGEQGFHPPSSVNSIEIVNVAGLEKKAQPLFSKGAFGYIAGGSGDELTLHENRRAYDDFTIVPRYLTGLNEPDISTELLGSKLSAPLVCPPCAAHGLAHTTAERGSSRGVAESGCLFTMQTLSNTSIEDTVASSPTGAKWFQLYFAKDQAINRDLLQRAKAAGALAIVFAVDLEKPGNREADTVNNFHFPTSLTFPNLPSAAGESLGEMSAKLFKQGLTWDDLTFIQKESGLPVVIKGVLSPADAREALRCGVAAIQVSNHGGRQLDGVPASIKALPGIVEIVDGKVPILVDGGVRRGIDVFRAIALGASAVGLGRPMFYGLALGGWMGVHEVFEKVKEEFKLAMKLAGVKDVRSIDRSCLTP